MKAKIKTKIVGFNKSDGNILLALTGEGRTETANINAQWASLNGTLTLRSLIADKISLGATITITVSDEETE
jgi:hypothetical protein